MRWLSIVCSLTLLFSAAGMENAQSAEPVAFKISLPAESAAKSLSGRLFLFLSQSDRREPRFGPDWFQPEPFFAMEVHDFKPGESRTLDDKADSFPAPLSKLPAGKYFAQALLDHDFYHRNHAQGVGNLYSKSVVWQHDPQKPATPKLVLDQVVAAEPFPEQPWLREVVLKSELLSKFHRREVLERCAVVLPAGYDEHPERRYPVMYVVPSFGQNHRMALSHKQAGKSEPGDLDFIRVYLSGECKWGHHVYADSATNGPRGRALVDEMIPYIDKHFRTLAVPAGRLLTGHSSGGWSSLWLQVAYPDTFGGVWSTAPDPVDFRDWQQVNLYADPPQSLYFDAKGAKRPIARRGTEPVLWYEAFGRMDDVLGRGGQLRSFEAVFSPLGDDGQPVKMWDRQTGKVDPRVVKAWEDYDIRLKLERNWKELGPKLAGKLHIITGELDTYYLEGAVRELGKSLKELGSDAVVTIVPGADHRSVFTQALGRQIRKEMSDTARRALPKD